jgi:hypothetical protein
MVFNEIISLAGMCMRLEIILLPEITLTEKDKYHIFPLIFRMQP